MRAAFRPLHLLFLTEPFAHHLIHRGLHKARNDDLAMPIPLAIIRDAQFLAVCSASTLVEKLITFSPLQSSSPAKTRTSSRPFRAHGHHRRPSTTCSTLNDRV